MMQQQIEQCIFNLLTIKSIYRRYILFCAALFCFCPVAHLITGEMTGILYFLLFLIPLCYLAYGQLFYISSITRKFTADTMFKQKTVLHYLSQKRILTILLSAFFSLFLSANLLNYLYIAPVESIVMITLDAILFPRIVTYGINFTNKLPTTDRYKSVLNAWAPLIANELVMFVIVAITTMLFAVFRTMIIATPHETIYACFHEAIKGATIYYPNNFIQLAMRISEIKHNILECAYMIPSIGSVVYICLILASISIVPFAALSILFNRVLGVDFYKTEQQETEVIKEETT